MDKPEPDNPTAGNTISCSTQPQGPLKKKNHLEPQASSSTAGSSTVSHASVSGKAGLVLLPLIFPPRSAEALGYCRLFPAGYEMEGDDLLQLLVAADVLDEAFADKFAYFFLKTTKEDQLRAPISFMRQDSSSGKKWYKLYPSCDSIPPPNIVRVDKSDGIARILSKFTTKISFHASFQNLPSNLEFLCKFSKIKTILLLRGHKSSHIDHIPYEFFTSLNLLQVLDLSGTKLSQLPTSLGAAKHLRYLNLSDTLIQGLPETIRYLSYLHTLKLRNCTRLIALPKSLSRLTGLRHLDLGTLCNLRSMPPNMGALSDLYTLSNFVVGLDSGCSIRELGSLSRLRGRVCISRLENVPNGVDAVEAWLYYKMNIVKLELRWTDSLGRESVEGDSRKDEQVIQGLEPPRTLQDLQISCYGGSKLPNWISMFRFRELRSITLFQCTECQVLPSLGQLPSLEFLSLIELVGIDAIDLHFCIETHTPCGDDCVAFPKLQTLEIKSMLNLEEWRDVGKVRCFPRLTKLTINNCPKLATLCKLSNMHCLEYLEINHCGKLQSLPEGGLPASVETFVIDDCPLLSESWSSSLEGTQDWHQECTERFFIYRRVPESADVS